MNYLKHLFINVGIEGTGHHLVCDIWRHSNLPIKRYSPDILLHKRNKHNALWLQERLMNTTILNNTLFCADSWPSGHFAYDRHFDIMALAYLQNVRFHFIYLQRNITAAMLSAERRFHSNRSNSYHIYSKLDQKIQYSMEFIEPSRFIKLQYEWICNNVTLYQTTLNAYVSRILGKRRRMVYTHVNTSKCSNAVINRSSVHTFHPRLIASV